MNAPMPLHDLLDGVADTAAAGDIVVTGLTLDSRAVRPGDAFVALRGTRTHGIEFAPAAVERGAVVVLAESPGPGTRDPGPATSGVSANGAVLDSADATHGESAAISPTSGPGTRDPGPATSGVSANGDVLDSADATHGESAAISPTSGPGSRVPGPATSGVSANGAVLDSADATHGESAAISPTSGPGSRVPGPVLWIDNLRTHLGTIAGRYFGHPSAALTVIGVTGTNGKTSTVQLLAQALALLGHRAASIGTLGAGLVGAMQSGERTTPDVISTHSLLARFRDADASHVVMEVSSHALDQGRVDEVGFDLAVFTNLTRDHLDYHGSMQAYGEAKARLFAWPGLRTAVVNVDDEFGRALAARLPADVRRLRVGTDAHAEVRASDVRTSTSGLDFQLHTPWGEAAVASGLLGRFNVANLLAVAACLGALDQPFARIVEALQRLEPVPGRMSRLGGHGDRPLLVVDYAHTPDALQQSLASLRAHCRGRLICVFGCGGDRDSGKRPEMGAIAERLADLAIVTDDNPRGEDGDAIVADILAGFVQPQAALVERDRAAAIALALRQARAGDVVLVAGKGHETYQEVAGARRPFDDMAVARAAMEDIAC